ncbi:uncharacterized protein LOC144145524 [Haemaphysalis longicornis]
MRGRCVLHLQDGRKQTPIKFPRQLLFVFVPVVVMTAVACAIALLAGLRAFTDDARRKVCRSPACVEYAARLRNSLNVSVRPCDNFTRFVCDGWSRMHQLGVHELLVTRALSTMHRSAQEAHVPKTGQNRAQRGIALYRSCNGVLQGSHDELPAVVQALEEVGITWPRRSGNPDVLHTILASSLSLGWDVLVRVLPLRHPPRQPGKLTLAINKGRTIIDILNRTSQSQTTTTGRAYFELIRKKLLAAQNRSSGADEVTFEDVCAIEEGTKAQLKRTYFRPDMQHAPVENVFDTPLSRTRWEQILSGLGFSDMRAGRIAIELVTANPDYVHTFFELWRKIGEAGAHLFVSWYTVQVAVLLANQQLITNFYDGDIQRALAFHVAFCFGRAYAISRTAVFSGLIGRALKASSRDRARHLALSVRMSFSERLPWWGKSEPNVTVVGDWTSLDTTFRAFEGEHDHDSGSVQDDTWAGSLDLSDDSLVANLRNTSSLVLARSAYDSGPPGGLAAGRACCLFRAKVLRLGSPVCGCVGSRAPQVLALGEGFSLLGPEGSPSWASDLDCDMRRPCTRGWALGRRINSLLGCCRGACQLAPSLPSRRCPGGA